MDPHDPSEWHDTFVASAGAAAALAGLVFVAVSINIDRILKTRGVADRGLQTVLMLLGAVVVSILSLVPQSATALGIEVLIASVALSGWIVATTPRTLVGTRGHPAWVISRVAINSAGTIPGVVGAILLLIGAGGGLPWIIGGVVASIVGGVINAWVLLVEILR